MEALSLVGVVPLGGLALVGVILGGVDLGVEDLGVLFPLIVDLKWYKIEIHCTGIGLKFTEHSNPVCYNYRFLFYED